MSRQLDPRLVAEVPKTRQLLAALAVFQTAAGFLAVAQAVLLADIIGDQFGRHRQSVTDDLVALVVVGILRAGVTAAQEWMVSRAAVHVQAALRSQTLSAIVRLGPAWSGRQPPGRLVTATAAGLEAVEGYVTRALPAMVAACVVPPVVVIAIAVEDWQSAVVLLVVLPLIPVFMVLVGITTRRRMATQYAALAAMAGHFLDLVQGLTTLKIYGQAHRQRESVERDAENYRRQTMGMLRMAFMSGLVLDLVATLGIAVVAVDVGLRLDGGHLHLTAALVVLLLAPELFAPLRAVGAQFHANEAGQAAIGAALDIIDEAAPSPRVVSGTAPSFTGGLRLSGLTVTYPGRCVPAVDGVFLEVAAGQVIGIQGVSGAGKTTLLLALLGFVPTNDALERSTVAGWESAVAVDPTLWRSNLAWVPQLPAPTQPTVAREVLLGDPGATPEEVASVLALCRTPPAGTSLGEDGRTVSAGERRRVALARAVLRARSVIGTGQTPLMLLDEPSEDLDQATENVVLAVITELAGLATIVISTHSETVLATADRRVVMAGGRVQTVLAQLPVRSFALLPTATPASRVVARRQYRPSARQSLPLLQDSLRRLVVPSLVSGAAGLCGLALTATSLWLICRASERPNVQALAIAVVGVRTFALGRGLLRYAERLSGHDAALRVVRDVRSRVFAGLIPRAPGGLDGFRRGDLLRRFVADVDAVQEGLVRAAIPTAGAVITALGAVVFAAVLDPWAGVVLFAGLLVAVCFVPALTTAVAGPGGPAAEVAARRDSRVCATLDGLAELVAYGAAEAAVRDVVALDGQAGRATRRSCAAAGFGSMLAGLVTAVTLVGVVATGVHARGLAPVTVGVLLACVLAAFDAVAPLPAAYAAWGRFSAARARVCEVVEGEPAMPVGDRGAPTGRLGLLADRLDLAAGEALPIVLRDITFSVGAGERVAVMGPSGCGKSTLLAAALRLRPVAGGGLAITGALGPVPVADLAECGVPAVIAGSLQGDHVFNASLRDNLRVVRPDASDAELDAVAGTAGLLAVVHEMPSGWSTTAGPDGCALSGGQRQRLLLARALLADPAILVLDEPTAHLDAETERSVLERIFTERRQAMLISTHRRLPAGSVDAVLHIRDGRLIEPAALQCCECSAEEEGRAFVIGAGVQGLALQPLRGRRAEEHQHALFSDDRVGALGLGGKAHS